MFSAVNGILLRPLPFARPAELVAIRGRNLGRDARGTFISWPDYAAWRDENHSFANYEVWRAVFPTLADGVGDVDRVSGADVSPGFFSALGVPAALGRTFAAGDDRANGQGVVVIGHDLWRRRYGGDPSILGRAIQVSGASRVVIGIMPPAFDFPERAEVWLPLHVDASRERRNSRVSFAGLARLKPGVTIETARADLSTIARRLETEFPQENQGWDADARSLREDLTGLLQRPILILLGAAVLVLLIACANVANLMLARGEARTRELAVRVALGATGRDIARQVLAEAVMVAILGGAVGAALALVGVRMLALAFPDGVPSYISLSIDATSLVVTVSVSLACGVLFGIPAAYRATRRDTATSLREGGRGTAGSAGAGRTRDALVASELALSVVLMIGAILLIRSDLTLEDSLGFETRGILSFRTPLPGPDYDDTRRHAFYDELALRVGALPGVEAVATTQALPFSPVGGPSERAPVVIEGERGSSPDGDPTLRVQIGAGYLRTLGVRFLNGRDFATADQAPSARVAIVNEEFARRHFAGRDAVGQRLMFTGGQNPAWTTIVGVVTSIRHAEPPRPIEPAVYLPYTQGSQTIVVRTALADPMTIVPGIRAIIRQLDPRVPTYLIQTLDQVVARALWRQRLQSQVFGIFAMLALALAAFGIYAVISYSVAQRTREFGVRMALGSSKGQMIGMVLSHAGLVTLSGIVVGMAAALALNRVLASLLYGIHQPIQPRSSAWPSD